MCFGLTAITWRLMEDADETSINTNPPIYTYEVRTRSEDDIKRKRRQQKGGGEKRNTGTFCNQICN